MMDVTVVLDKLAGLTVHEIAEEMRSLGIQGMRACPETCIIAAYLTHMTGIPPHRLGVGITLLSVYSDHNLNEDYQFMELPSQISQFISDFDYGLFPDLQVREDKEKECLK